jgi:hypothetical protein
LQHPELPAGITLVGYNNPGYTHGTRVLGVVASQDIQSGCRGIAFEAQCLAVSLFQDDGTGTMIFSRAEALKAARTNRPAGSVILLETQVDHKGEYVPAEADALVMGEIQAATVSDILVVEAAGNDQVDIDRILNRVDSGAVIVAAAQSTAGGWTAMGNHGSMIRCFAQGTSVATIDPVNANGTSVIARTSAATAIVAGAAAIIQSWYQRYSGGGCLSANHLRDLLSDPAHNTNPARGNDIGVMPNATAIRDVVIQNA